MSQFIKSFSYGFFVNTAEERMVVIGLVRKQRIGFAGLVASFEKLLQVGAWVAAGRADGFSSAAVSVARREGIRAEWHGDERGGKNACGNAWGHKVPRARTHVAACGNEKQDDCRNLQQKHDRI